MDDMNMVDIEKAQLSLREAFEDYDKGALTKTQQIAPDFNVFCVLYALVTCPLRGIQSLC